MTPRTTVFHTQKQFLRDAILDIAAQAASMEEFQKLLKEKYGIDVKENRGRLSYLHPNRSKYISGRALGSDYEKEHIKEMMKLAVREKDYDPSYDYHANPVAILYVRSNLRLVVDLQTNIKAQQNAAYARKVKLSNLKEMARTVVYVQEHGYDTREYLLRYQNGISEKEKAVDSSLAEASAKLKKTNEQIHYTGQYYASKAVHAEFLKSRNKKQFREAHRAKLDQYNEAVRYFKENGDGKIPSMKSLKAEKQQLTAYIKAQKKTLAAIRQEQKELQTAVSNIDAILRDEPSPRKEKRKAEPEL